MPLLVGGRTVNPGSQQVGSVHVDIGANTANFERGAAKVTGGMAQMGLSIGAITSALAVMKGAWDFSVEGAKLQRLSDAGAEIARQYGGNMDLIIQKVKEASRGAVSEMDIIRSTNKAMMLGLGADADQMAELMEIAAFRGRAMGLDTTQAFDDIVRGIGRTSPMILDNLGIVISAKDTYAEYAESIGKTASELTKQEKTQALLNRVLQEGNKMLDEAGGLQDDAASKIERLDAAWQNFMDHRKRDAAGETSGIATILAAGLEKLDEKLLDVERQTDLSREAMRRLNISMEDGISAGETQAIHLEIQKIKQEELAAATSAAADATDDMTVAGEDLEAQLEAMSDANKEFLSTLDAMQSAEESYQDKVNSLTDERMELEAEKQKLLAQGWWEESEKIQDINAKLEENNKAVQVNAEEHELATRKIVLGLLEQKLAQDGLTDEELGLLLEKGQAWGIYSQTVVEETRKAVDEANLLADTLNGLPDSKTFSMIISSVGMDQLPSAYVQSEKGRAPKKRNNIVGHAAGGAVEAGQPYMVGEQGAELFVPYQSGNIVPNNVLQSKNNNQDVIAAIMATKLDERRLARSIVGALARAG